MSSSEINPSQAPIKFTFGKNERLKSKKQIELLFEKGKSADVLPLKVIWLPDAELQSDFPALAAFSVSKKKFPKAVDRNRIKRLMREAYRLQKHELYKALEEKNKQIALMFIYTGKKKITFAGINMNLSALLKILKERL